MWFAGLWNFPPHWGGSRGSCILSSFTYTSSVQYFYLHFVWNIFSSFWFESLLSQRHSLHDLLRILTRYALLFKMDQKLIKLEVSHLFFLILIIELLQLRILQSMIILSIWVLILLLINIAILDHIWCHMIVLDIMEV